MFVCMLVCLSVCLAVCLFVRLPVFLFVCLFFCLFAYLCVSSTVCSIHTCALMWTGERIGKTKKKDQLATPSVTKRLLSARPRVGCLATEELQLFPPQAPPTLPVVVVHQELLHGISGIILLQATRISHRIHETSLLFRKTSYPPSVPQLRWKF